MTDAMKAIREKQARGDWDLRPEQLRMLLLVERTVIETAPREVLQARLDERLRDKAFRTRNSAEGWPGSVSNRWLQQEIDYLQDALTRGVTGRCNCSGIGHNGVSPTCPIHAGVALPDGGKR